MTIFCFEHRDLCIVVLKKKRGNKTPYKHTPHTHTSCQLKFTFVLLTDIRTRPRPISPIHPGKRLSS